MGLIVFRVGMYLLLFRFGGGLNRVLEYDSVCYCSES